MIYLDNAATTRPKPPGVAEAVAAAMNDYGNSGRGTHPEALEAAFSYTLVACGLLVFSFLTLTLTGSPANRYGKHPVPYGLER